MEDITLKGVKYFLLANSINSKASLSTKLVILTPKKQVMATYYEKILESIIVSCIVILFLTPLILQVSSLMAKPILKLTRENEKIKNRRFSEVIHVDTSIKELQELSSSLVSMAHAIKEHKEAQTKLMDSFIKLIAEAIDAKSEYTGGHCKKVPIITLMLARAASQSQEEVFKEFKLESDEEIRELSIAAWLHDCGKVTTPEYVWIKQLNLRLYITESTR